MSLTIAADYFNQKIVQFEPLIEHWTLSVMAKKSANPLMSVQVISEERLYFNVSHALIETLGALMEILRKDYYSPKVAVTLEKGEEYSPYWISNQTGSPITFVTGDIRRDVTVGDKVSLGFSETKNLKLESTSATKERFIDFHIPNCSAIERIPLDKVGAYIKSVKHVDTGQKLKVLCRVELVAGSKLITVGSLTVLHNQSHHPLEVAIYADEEKGEPHTVLKPLGNFSPHSPQAPQEKVSVPLGLAAQGRIVVRPESGNYQWPGSSTALPLSSLADYDNEEPFRVHLFSFPNLTKFSLSCSSPEGKTFHNLVNAKAEKLNGYNSLSLSPQPTIPHDHISFSVDHRKLFADSLNFRPFRR